MNEINLLFFNEYTRLNALCCDLYRSERGVSAGIVIGLTLTLVHIFGIYFTGTSVNPARSFDPALFAGGDALANVWVFIVAPLVGGVLAALVYKFLDSSKDKE